MSDRPFKVLGIQQIAIGGLDKSKLSPAAIERGCDFLAQHRWQGEGGRGVFGHGGCGRAA